MRRQLLLIVLILFLIDAGDRLAIGAAATFTKVADTSTPIPGGTGNFIGFSPPSLDGPNVAFQASGVSLQSGIYDTLGGTLQKVADTKTLVPGGIGTFTQFYNPVIEGNVVAFGAIDSVGQPGIYRSVNGTIEVVANASTPVPNATGNFATFLSVVGGATNVIPVTLDQGAVGFWGRGTNGSEGIYSNQGGTLHAVVDKTIVAPGTSTSFAGFTLPTPPAPGPFDAAFSFDQGEAAFWGYYKDAGNVQHYGLYSNIGGTLHLVADANTPRPDVAGTFGNFYAAPVVDQHEIAFGTVSLPTGIGIPGATYFKTSGGGLELISNSATLVPGYNGAVPVPYAGFNNGHVAIAELALGLGPNQPPVQAMYTDLTGSLARLIGTGDTLDGKQVTGVFVGHTDTNGVLQDTRAAPAISGNHLAFNVTLNNPLLGGSIAVYVAAVPEPTTVMLAESGLLCAAIAMGAARICRRRRTSRDAKENSVRVLRAKFLQSPRVG